MRKCDPLGEELEIQLGPTLSGNGGGEQNSHSLNIRFTGEAKMKKSDVKCSELMGPVSKLRCGRKH